MPAATKPSTTCSYDNLPREVRAFSELAERNSDGVAFIDTVAQRAAADKLEECGFGKVCHHDASGSLCWYEAK